VQDRIVAAKPAEQLTEAADQPGCHVFGFLARQLRASRELLGVVGHHERVSLYLSPITDMTPLAARTFRRYG
jgi:hypothetical protein